MKKSLLFYSILTITLIGCFDRKKTKDLKIINELNKDVYVLNITYASLNETYGGMDTTIFYDLYRAKKHSTHFMQNKPPNWKSYVNSSPQGKMRIYIIPVDSIKLHGWKHFFKNYSNFDSLKIDMDYLRKNHWEITLK